MDLLIALKDFFVLVSKNKPSLEYLEKEADKVYNDDFSTLDEFIDKDTDPDIKERLIIIRNKVEEIISAEKSKN